MISAYVTLVLVIIHYLLDYQNNRTTQNRVDRAWIKFLTPEAWNDPERRPSARWIPALEAAVLMYSDIQVLTGIATLLSAFSQLQRGISIYHWQVTVQLAWFSSMTHLTTLTSLRAYFRERPRMAIWRLFFMGVTLLLLIVALVPTGNINPGIESGTERAYPAACLFSEWNLFTSFNIPLTIFSLLILLTSYATRVVRLFKPLSDHAHGLLRRAPGNFANRCFDHAEEMAASSERKTLWTCIKFLIILAYVFFKAVYEISESMLWEVCSTHFWFGSIGADSVQQDNLANDRAGLGYPQTDTRGMGRPRN